MKWNNIWRQIIDAAGSLTHAFGTVIVWCIVGLFVVVSIVSILWKMEDTPIRGIEGAAASLPSILFVDMLGMEIHQLPGDGDSSSFSTDNISGFLTSLATGVNIGDPRTLVAQTLPGASHQQYVMLVRGKDTEAHEYPLEIPPSPDLALQEETGMDGVSDAAPDPSSPDSSGEVQEPGPSDNGQGKNSGEGQSEGQGAGNNGTPSGNGTDNGTPSNPEDEPSPPVIDLSKKVVFVYHSHNTESYLPELKDETEPNRAYSKDNSINVISVGQRLIDLLASKGLGAVHSDKAYDWKSAYSESRKTVKAVMQKNSELQFILDLHRDSDRREKTTLTNGGKTYAKLWFVIGKKNPQFKQNYQFAEELNRRVEEKLPGISRGIVGKLEGSNGEFNQSLSPYSVIVEVGGVDNTLEETYRTMEIFADAIAEMYWDNSESKKVDAAPSPQIAQKQ